MKAWKDGEYIEVSDGSQPTVSGIPTMPSEEISSEMRIPTEEEIKQNVLQSSVMSGASLKSLESLKPVSDKINKKGSKKNEAKD